MTSLNQQQFIRMKDLANRSDNRGLIGVSAQTIWKWVKNNQFPQPIKLGTNITVWRLSDINTWMKGKGL